MNSKIITDISNFMFVEDKPSKADIIFLPGDGNPQIPEKAAELYKEGYAPLLMPAGGVGVKLGKFSGVQDKKDVYSLDYKTDCEFYTDVLLRNGVPRSAILCEDKSGHTRDNAFLSRLITDEVGLDIKRAIICCKSFHSRRCLMLYQLAFEHIEFIVVPVDVYGITRDSWHTQPYGIERVFGELARCGNQFVGDINNYLLKGEEYDK